MSWGGKRSVSWGGRAAVLLLVVALIVPMLALGGASVALAKAQPALLQMAAGQPGAMLDVIVQKAGTDGSVEETIASLGGQVTRELGIINAIAATMPAGEVKTLAMADSVRWVSLDGPVAPTSIHEGQETVGDQFNQESYGNNDGSASWLGDWTESGDDGNARYGYVQIEGDFYCASYRCLRFKLKSGQMAERAADLSAAGFATLSFDYNLWTGDRTEVALQVSTDGQNWTTLSNQWDQGGIRRATFDLTPYRSDSTRIRFTVVKVDRYYPGYFRVDNLEIAYETMPGLTYTATSNAQQAWEMGYDGDGIGIAIVDSGISQETDFGARVKEQLSFNASSSPDDTNGHGTHVAGIIGGDGKESNGMYRGIAPEAELYSLRVSDDTGAAQESDVVAALQWVFENHAARNIRVVNLSLNATLEQSYHNSAIDAAAEILWFNGVVVVASAGNASSGSGMNTIMAAPANDPFIITVGASHENGTADRADDTMATFSAYGTTADGFAKPDIIAPGKDIYSTLSAASDWDSQYPERVVTGGEYFRLSGTSMSAPMVSGAVALMLEANPSLTPDQVKYRLTHSGSMIPGAQPGTTYPYLDVYAAVTGTSTESANTGLEASQLLWTGSEPVMWDSVSWNSVSWNSVSWNSVSWDN